MVLFCGYRRAKLEVVEVSEHKVVHLVVLWLRIKGDFCHRKLAVLDALEDAHPKGCIEQDSQRNAGSLHGFPPCMWLRKRTDNPRREGYLPRVCETAGLPTGSSAPSSVHIAFLSLRALLIGSGAAPHYDRSVGKALKTGFPRILSLLNPSSALPQAHTLQGQSSSCGRLQLPHRCHLLHRLRAC